MTSTDSATQPSPPKQTAPGDHHARLSPLRRPSGGFAMLALDQREALRAMLAEHQDSPVTDGQVTEFKLAAARALTRYASGVLLDRQFVWDRAVTEAAVAPGCGLIAAADRFEAAHGDLVGEVTIDKDVDLSRVRTQGGAAAKLLVLHRPDGDPATRIGMVREFVAGCDRAGLASIIEPVSRPPLDGREWDWDAGVLAAATELGSLGADLYKAEVPLRGQGEPDEIRRRCGRLTEMIDSPWVVLSSGVPHQVFPRAVALACAAGASGFLAGRAVWAACVGAPDLDAALKGPAVDRLTRLCDVVDEAVGG